MPAGRPGRLLLAGLVVAALGWFLLARWEAARRVVYIIPPGVASGQATIQIPDEIVLTVGVRDTLVIENLDDTVHTFGPFVVGPQTTVTKRFNRALVYEGVCTVHPDEQMKLIVNPAPWDIFR